MATEPLQPGAAPANTDVRVKREDIRAIAFEQIEAMILTIDAAQLFDHPDDPKTIALGATMFNVIVDRLLQARRDLDATFNVEA